MCTGMIVFYWMLGLAILGLIGLIINKGNWHRDEYVFVQVPTILCLFFSAGLIFPLIGEPFKASNAPVKIENIVKLQNRVIVIHQKGEIVSKDILAYTAPTNSFVVTEHIGKNIFGFDAGSEFTLAVVEKK